MKLYASILIVYALLMCGLVALYARPLLQVAHILNAGR